MKRIGNKVRRQLEDQDHECCYCGKRIRRLRRVARCYDNVGVVHLKCVNLGRV